jgi:hypothetical protein
MHERGSTRRLKNRFLPTALAGDQPGLRSEGSPPARACGRQLMHQKACLFRAFVRYEHFLHESCRRAYMAPISEAGLPAGVATAVGS